MSIDIINPNRLKNINNNKRGSELTMQSTLLASTIAQPKDLSKGNSTIYNQEVNNKNSLFTVKMEGNYRVLEGVGVLEGS